MTAHPRHRLRRGVCVSLFAIAFASASGCSSYKRMAPPDAGYVAPPKRLSRVTLDDQSQIKVRNFRVDGDTLRFTQGNGADSLRAIPAARMVGYEERHADWVKTSLLIVSTGGLVYLALIWAVLATGGAS